MYQQQPQQQAYATAAMPRAAPAYATGAGMPAGGGGGYYNPQQQSQHGYAPQYTTAAPAAHPHQYAAVPVPPQQYAAAPIPQQYAAAPAPQHLYTGGGYTAAAPASAPAGGALSQAAALYQQAPVVAPRAAVPQQPQQGYAPAGVVGAAPAPGFAPAAPVSTSAPTATPPQFYQQQASVPVGTAPAPPMTYIPQTQQLQQQPAQVQAPQVQQQQAPQQQYQQYGGAPSAPRPLHAAFATPGAPAFNSAAPAAAAPPAQTPATAAVSAPIPAQAQAQGQAQASTTTTEAVTAAAAAAGVTQATLIQGAHEELIRENAALREWEKYQRQRADQLEAVLQHLQAWQAGAGAGVVTQNEAGPGGGHAPAATIAQTIKALQDQIVVLQEEVRKKAAALDETNLQWAHATEVWNAKLRGRAVPTEALSDNVDATGLMAEIETLKGTLQMTKQESLAHAAMVSQLKAELYTANQRLYEKGLQEWQDVRGTVLLQRSDANASTFEGGYVITDPGKVDIEAHGDVALDQSGFQSQGVDTNTAYTGAAVAPTQRYAYEAHYPQLQLPYPVRQPVPAPPPAPQQPQTGGGEDAGSGDDDTDDAGSEATASSDDDNGSGASSGTDSGSDGSESGDDEDGASDHLPESTGASAQRSGAAAVPPASTSAPASSVRGSSSTASRPASSASSSASPPTSSGQTVDLASLTKDQLSRYTVAQLQQYLLQLRQPTPRNKAQAVDRLYDALHPSSA